MQPAIAEIRLFAGTFAPADWAFCQGQIMSIAQNTALFALIGTTYGGNGQTTFALPDLRGRSPFGAGQGPGLPNITLGEVSGTENTTLLSSQLPIHNHALTGTMVQHANAERAGTVGIPTGAYPSIVSGVNAYTNTPTGNMAPYTNTMILGSQGSNQPFSIQPAYLCLNFIISLAGIFPSRN